MALVDHKMPVIGNDVVHLALAHQTLDDADIDDAAGLALSAADSSDIGRGRSRNVPSRAIHCSMSWRR